MPPRDLLEENGLAPRDVLAPPLAKKWWETDAQFAARKIMDGPGTLQERKEKVFELWKHTGWGSGVPPLMKEVGGAVTDLASKNGASPEVAASLGVMGNFLGNAAMTFGTAGKFVGAPVQSLLDKPARVLMQSAIKPDQAARLSGDADKAITSMLQQNIGPTRAGMDKAAAVSAAMDAKAGQAVAGSPEAVSVLNVASRLEEPFKQAMKQVNPQADMAAMESAWEAFKKSPLIAQQARLAQEYGPAAANGDVTIPVQLAHELKKGTYAALGSKSYGEVGSASTEAQKALARGLREEVAAKVPEAAEALKLQAEMMRILDVARNRAILEGNKNPVGLGALRLGDNPLSTLGFMADRSAAVKGWLAQILFDSGRPQLMAPALSPSVMGALDPRQGALAAARGEGW